MTIRHGDPPPVKAKGSGLEATLAEKCTGYFCAEPRQPPNGPVPHDLSIRRLLV